MTTKANFISQLKKRLGNNNDSTLDADIEVEMDWVQDNILEQTPLEPHFLISEEYSNTTTADERRVPVPSGFINEVHTGQLWIYDSTATVDEDKWTALKKADIEALRKRWPGSGEPKGYDLQGDYFLLFPKPDKAYSLRIYIFDKEPLPSSLGDGSENAWLEHASDWFMQEVGAIIAGQYLQDADMESRFLNRIQQARSRLHYMLSMREEMGRDRFMGEG